MKKRELYWWLLVLLGLLGMYFFSRFIAIRSLPPFNDEFIYVRWAQEGFFDPGKRLVSLTDGKQPLYIWLTSFTMNLVPSPLAAGRIVSILAGAATMLGLGVLSWQLLRNRFITIASCILYILFPLALVLDRFALYDSLLASLTVWSMVVMFLLTQKPTLGASLVLALILGAAFLTKSSAVLLVIMLPLTVVFFGKNLKQKLHIISYFILAVFVAYVYQSVQWLSLDALAVGNKNATFVYTLRELSTTPIAPLIATNVSLYAGWIGFYVTIPLLLAMIASFTGKTHRKASWYLFLSFLAPFAAVVLVGKLVYPRHLFFLTMPLLILAGAGIVRLWQAIRKLWVKVAFIAILFLPIGYITTTILTDFKTAQLPTIDQFQYVDGWPAGWGVKEITRYLESESTKGELTVITEGVFGSLPTTAMKLYFGNYPQVHIVPIDDEKMFMLPPGIDWQHPVYLLLNRVQEVPKQLETDEIFKIQKGNGNFYIRLLRLKPVDDEGLEPPASSV